MAKQTFTSGQTLTASQMTTLQQNDWNWSTSVQTGNYTLVAADAGTREIANAGTAITFTVPNNTFTAGDVVEIHNIGAGTLTLAAGTGVTLNTAGSLTVAQWQNGTLYATSTSAFIWMPRSNVADYQSFTPTWTNLTVGNATQNFQYYRMGQFIHLFGNIILGSTSSVSGAIRFSNPVNADAALTGQMFAFCEIQDTGAATFGAGVAQQAAGTFEIYALNVAGTYSTAALTSSTVPMSWASTDEITINIVYKAA